jgi:5-carboxymethyl-2-hydroxymuconate isomerase
LRPLDDQHAERAFIHLQIEAAAGRRAGHHAQHIFSVLTPGIQVFDLSDEIAQ